jgi:general secretion pathway protein B
MSYILDALNKSEAERTRSARPSLGTVHHPVQRSRITAWIIAGALAVNAGVGIVWLTSRDRPAPALIAPIAATAAKAPAPAIAPARQPSIPAATIVTPVRSSMPQSASAATAATVPDVSNIVFSTHVYSDDPAMRAVTVHGKRFVEGDMITKGVRLVEITETGVVLEANGRRIPLDVLQGWH